MTEQQQDIVNISTLIFIFVGLVIFLSIFVWKCGSPMPPQEGTQFFFGIN